LLSGFEKGVSPLCRWIGFRSYMSLDSLLPETSLAVRRSFRVNPFRYWHIIQCINRKPAHGFA
jgi:phosphatidylethanolamine/phosphatidyl-N-methylethanolamine N-methyltransferase